MLDKFVTWLSEGNPQTASENMVIRYGAELLLENSFKITMLLGAGFMIGKGYETIIFLVVFCSLRTQAGGFHAVGEFESIREFEAEYLGINKDQKSLGVWILSVAAVYGAISMVFDMAYVFAGVDVKTWVRNNLVVPFTEEAKNMKLYSVSGGITNPYPPNSYQYSQFNKTNYYWVVE